MLKLASLLLVAVTVATLTGCTQPVAMDAAPDAANELCAEVSVRLPDTVADAELRETNAQGTGAWGTPAIALLQCGVEVDAISSLECRTFEGIDWLIDPSDENLVTATTYGRDPAIRVAIDKNVTGPGVILAELARAVSQVPATKTCNE
jgi:hypothetical protein